MDQTLSRCVPRGDRHAVTLDGGVFVKFLEIKKTDDLMCGLFRILCLG